MSDDSKLRKRKLKDSSYKCLECDQTFHTKREMTYHEVGNKKPHLRNRKVSSKPKPLVSKKRGKNYPTFSQDHPRKQNNLENLDKEWFEMQSKFKQHGSGQFNCPVCKNSSEKIVGGGKKQYRGRRSSLMVKVPENVRKTALYAYKLKDIGFKGGNETGWKRALQLSKMDQIPIEDLRYMRNWFARHIITSYPTYKKWLDAGRPKDSSWFNKHGIIAWLIWAGDAAFKWVNSKHNIKMLNEYFNKDYKPIRK